MGEVVWSDQAQADLEGIDPAIRDQVRRDAEETLAAVEPRNGVSDEIMWFQAQDCVVFHRPANPEGCEVLAVRRLAGTVAWLDQAAAELEGIDPAIRNQVRRNAEVTLPDAQPCLWTGSHHGISWHRGITHEHEHQVEWLELEDADGIQPCDYYLFYRELEPGGVEVIAVLSAQQIANAWVRITRERPPDSEDEQSGILPLVAREVAKRLQSQAP